MGWVLLLKQFWPYIAALVAALAVFGYVGYLRHEIRAKTGEISALQAQLQQQNALVDSLKSDAVRRQAQHEDELQRAHSEANATQAHAREILKRPAPKGMSDCDAASSLLNEALK